MHQKYATGRRELPRCAAQGDGRNRVSFAIFLTPSLWASSWPWQTSGGSPEWRGKLTRPWMAMPGWVSHNWPVGLMDKASAPGAGDSRLESWAGHYDALPEERLAWTIANWLACRRTHPVQTPWGSEGAARPGPRGRASFSGSCATTSWTYVRPTLGRADAHTIAAHTRFLTDLPLARICDHWGPPAMAKWTLRGQLYHGGDSAAGSA